MMFDYAFGRADIARNIEDAVTAALEEGARTPDLGGVLTSAAMTDAILAQLDGLMEKQHMTNRMTCGEATIRLLGRYGVREVFGIPGVHTLDFCRGLDTARSGTSRPAMNRGPGSWPRGYARATGKPGVALVISGPGVTNAATAVGQAWADSLPLLLLSAETSSETIGKGWGVLHEITEQKDVTRP